MTFSGCINIDPRTPTEMAAQSIDQAIASIDSNSDQWRNEVDKLGTKLETIESNAAQDVKDIAAKSIASGGQEIKCSTDFIRTRTKQDLQRLADKLRGKPTTPPLPTFCAVVPTGVDMNRRPNFVEFYGYDFKLRERTSSGTYIETPRVQAFLVSDSGETQLSSWTDLPTHYLLTIKTAPSDTIPICNKENRHIVLKSIDGQQLSSIGVSKLTCPTPPPQPTPKPETSYYYTHDTYGASLFAGGRTDREYGGPCSAGYHRSNYLVSADAKNGNADCYINNWVGDDPNLCKISVHFWADAPNGGVTCDIRILQAGDTPPAPPTPPCPCW